MADQDQLDRDIQMLREALKELEARRGDITAPIDLHRPLFKRVLEGIDVLAVEDDEDSREMLKASLSVRGAVVRAVASAREAMAALDERLPDIVVADIHMPEVDGYALIRTIRGRPAGQGGDIPAIALTAYDRDQDRAKSLELGYQAHIGKPSEPDAVVAVIASLLGR